MWYTVWEESFKTDFCVAKRVAQPVVYHWKKVKGCLTNEGKKQQCRGSHREVITVCARSIYNDCHGNEYWTTKGDQVLLESTQITTKGVRRSDHVPMVRQVLRWSWRYTRRRMGRASPHQPDGQHYSCERCTAARSSVNNLLARRTAAH